MRHKPIQIFVCKIISLHNIERNLRHIRYGILKYHFPFLINGMFVSVHRLVRGRILASTRFHLQRCIPHTVRMKDSIDNAQVFFRWLNHNGSGSITEKRTGGTIGIISYRRHFIAGNQNNFFVFPGLDKSVTHFKAIHKSRTGHFHVKTESIFYSIVLSNNRCRRWERMVGCCCGKDHAIDLFGFSIGFLEQFLYCFGSQNRYSLFFPF
ncbi:hypothetical protein SDC9_123899 [bioreactor metagenome]|uniref:Uncharacterized protein n=1 Tax=bioreactor metagenome TaxID=1076179 RepID=A0A645CIX5_9ZZZZ